MAVRFLWCLAKAVVRHSGKLLAGLVGADHVYEIAVDAWEDYRRQDNGNSLRGEVESLAQASPDQVRQEAQAAVAAEGGQLAPQDQQAAVAYLAQIPAMIRRSLRRPSDPGGVSVPARMALNGPEDLMPFLPPQPPRFKPGDHPFPGCDWVLEELLGMGGFGEVWKARQPHLSSKPPRAFKFCLDGVAVKALRNEAGVLDRVMQYGQHPGIVELLETHLNAEPPCLEYEFVSGCDLTSLIRELHANGPADVHAVNQRFLELVEIVAFAHQADIVHDDLKPANILVQRNQGDVALRITDFGIGGVATVVAVQESRRPTRSRQVLMTEAVRGAYTPMYASPEQMRRRPPEKPDPRDDVHALGVIWFQILTGNLTMLNVPTNWFRQVKERGLSEELSELLESCFAPEAANRPKNAVVLAGYLKDRLPEVVEKRRREAKEAERQRHRLQQETAEKQRRVAEEAERQRLRIAQEKEERQRCEAQEAERQRLQREKDNLRRWKDSGEPSKWCAAHGWQWSEHDWQALLDSLKRSAYWPLNANEAGETLEGLKAEQQARLRREAEERERVERLRQEGETRIAQAHREALERSGGKQSADVADLCRRYAIATDRAEILLRDVWDQWRKDHPPKESSAGTVITVTLKAKSTSGGFLGFGGKVAFAETTMKFALVPAGSFWMGGGGGQPGTKQVQIPHAFYLGIYPVTQAQWQAVMDGNPSYFKGDDLPVEQVSWNDAQEFIKRLNAGKTESEWMYRLPTEAEWEYACRGGVSSKEECSFHFYFKTPTNDLSSDQANFDGNHPVGNGKKGTYRECTTKVGSFEPNRLGLFDMHGNVWEWCQDLRDGGPSRVTRGGGWFSHGSDCQAACRLWYVPPSRNCNLGVRLARVPRQVAPDQRSLKRRSKGDDAT